MGRERPAAAPLPSREELLLKAAKEIVVKFIEVGRVSPASFSDTFNLVIDTLRQSGGYDEITVHGKPADGKLEGCLLRGLTGFEIARGHRQFVEIGEKAVHAGMDRRKRFTFWPRP